MDFYARIKVNGREYIEAMHEDQDDIFPTNWLALAPLPAGIANLQVDYDLWDEDVAGGGAIPSLRGDDDQCNIWPGKGYTWTKQGSVNTLPQGKIHTEGHDNDPDEDDEAAVDFVPKIIEPVPLKFGDAPDLIAIPFSDTEIGLSWKDYATGSLFRQGL
ncbi:MAG: hypothetical protein C4589_12430 [Peptococcaceae bacterium]|nr:MAG: hypothetical protein C4589_12430 [Peptococcaceae bacterium]